MVFERKRKRARAFPTTIFSMRATSIYEICELWSSMELVYISIYIFFFSFISPLHRDLPLNSTYWRWSTRERSCDWWQCRIIFIPFFIFHSTSDRVVQQPKKVILYMNEMNHHFKWTTHTHSSYTAVSQMPQPFPTEQFLATIPRPTERIPISYCARQWELFLLRGYNSIALSVEWQITHTHSHLPVNSLRNECWEKGNERRGRSIFILLLLSSPIIIEIQRTTHIRTKLSCTTMSHWECAWATITATIIIPRKK